jgi:hypothetical protein
MPIWSTTISIFTRCPAFGVFHLFEDPPRGGDIIDAGIGEGEFTGGARQ